MKCDLGIKVSYHWTLNFKRGVIRSPILKHESEADIASELADFGINSVQKIYYKNSDGIWEPSGTLILTFHSEQLPEKVKIGYQIFKVEPYIPSPLRCFKCQKFGHHSNNCKRQAICARCGSADHFNDKECDKVFNCPNCKGEHSAFDKNCPLYTKEKEIKKMMSTQNLRYNEAKAKYSLLNEASYASVVQSPAAQPAALTVYNRPQMISVGVTTETKEVATQTEQLAVSCAETSTQTETKKTRGITINTILSSFDITGHSNEPHRWCNLNNPSLMVAPPDEIYNDASDDDDDDDDDFNTDDDTDDDPEMDHSPTCDTHERDPCAGPGDRVLFGHSSGWSPIRPP